MELRHLRYFIAVAEELHFTRAAERLHISQPPLSQQIRDLETELGVALFERTQRRVTLTHAGRVFLAEASASLERIEEGSRRTQQAAKGGRGDLSVGFVGSATFKVLPPIIRTFRANYPDVRLHLHELTTVQQVDALNEGRIQVGFMRPDPGGENLDWTVIATEPWILAVPLKHPLAATDGAVRLEDVANESFILFPRVLGPSFYDQVIGACRGAGFSPNVTQEAIQMQTIIGLVAADVGVAMVPGEVRCLRPDAVSYKPIADAIAPTEMAAMWRAGDPSPVLQRFLDTARGCD